MEKLLLLWGQLEMLCKRPCEKTTRQIGTHIRMAMQNGDIIAEINKLRENINGT
jgi:hypothetical protein